VTVAALAAAAALGAIARWRLVVHGWRGTLAVNLVGSFVLGWLVAWRPGTDTLTVLGTGFCGALTTYGTFALEITISNRRHATSVAIGSVVGCVALAALGYALGG
jgi:CrcB protein